MNSITPKDQLNVPQKLPLKKVGKIIKVAAGGTACLVLNDKNEIYVWGYGILGKGPNVDYIRTPSLIPPAIFGCHELFNPDLKITQIYAGLRHFAAVSSDGDLYTWGKNRSGCLGLANGSNEPIDQFFPLKVEIPAIIKKVSLGADHTIVLGTNIL